MQTYTQLTNTQPNPVGTFLDSNGQPCHDSEKVRSIMHRLSVTDALSDDLTGYFIRQLTDIETTFYEVLYAPLKGMTLFPSSSAYNIAAENILFQVWDYRGKSRTIANYDVVDFPEADVLLKQLSVPVKGEGAKFSYTVDDLRASAMANQPLDQMKQLAAKRTIEQGVNRIIWNGDIDTGRVGILTDPDVPYGTVANDGTGGSTLFSAKTGQQIYRDISLCIQEVFDNSNGLFTANTLVLPPSQYELIARTPFAEQYMAKSILTSLKENFPGLNIEFAVELKGTSSITPLNDVMFAYEKKMEYACIAIPVPFEMFPPQMNSLKYSVLCRARTAGMIIRQPISINIKEGI
jgi:hypothetical protein